MRKEDKDTIIFVTKEVDESTSSSSSLPHDSKSSSSSSSSTSPSDSEKDSSQAEAYNPETGEINWDCPCLGNMTQPPCGDTFKVAFSCFVNSTAEPKGMDCVEQFKAMQECFKEHPDIYGRELTDDDDENDENNENEKENEGNGKEEKEGKEENQKKGNLDNDENQSEA